MEAMLEIENDQCGAVAELFEDRGDHHGTESHGVTSDHEEGELPGEACADETVEEGGVGDGRGILAGDGVEHEVERGEDEDAPDGGDTEEGFGEGHLGLGSSLGPAEVKTPTLNAKNAFKDGAPASL